MHARLVELGVEIELNRALVGLDHGEIETECVYSGQRLRRRCDAVVMVGSRRADDELWQALAAREQEWQARGIRSLRVIGDAEAPAPIAWATYAGHRYARELDTPDRGDALPFRREVTQLKD